MGGKIDEQESVRVHFEAGEPPEFGELVEERKIPSDASLATPLVVRICDLLATKGLVTDLDVNKIGTCLGEALRNAVIHGNGEDFQKLVTVRIFLGAGGAWEVHIIDQGSGFSHADVECPAQDLTIWKESGRGVRLMALYADSLKFYSNGSHLVLKFGVGGND